MEKISENISKDITISTSKFYSLICKSNAAIHGDSSSLTIASSSGFELKSPACVCDVTPG